MALFRSGGADRVPMARCIKYRLVRGGSFPVMFLPMEDEQVNDGSLTENSATISNGFDVAFPSCRVRFVMMSGHYTVTGGNLEQSYHAYDLTICDLRVPVAENSKTAVSIEAVAVKDEE